MDLHVIPKQKCCIVDGADKTWDCKAGLGNFCSWSILQADLPQSTSLSSVLQFSVLHIRNVTIQNKNRRHFSRFGTCVYSAFRNKGRSAQCQNVSCNGKHAKILIVFGNRVRSQLTCSDNDIYGEIIPFCIQTQPSLPPLHGWIQSKCYPCKVNIYFRTTLQPISKQLIKEPKMLPSGLQGGSYKRGRELAFLQTVSKVWAPTSKSKPLPLIKGGRSFLGRHFEVFVCVAKMFCATRKRKLDRLVFWGTRKPPNTHRRVLK